MYATHRGHIIQILLLGKLFRRPKISNLQGQTFCNKYALTLQISGGEKNQNVSVAVDIFKSRRREKKYITYEQFCNREQIGVLYIIQMSTALFSEWDHINQRKERSEQFWNGLRDIPSLPGEIDNIPFGQNVLLLHMQYLCCCYYYHRFPIQSRCLLQFSIKQRIFI